MKFKALSLLLAAILILPAISACADTSGATSLPEAGLTVTDMLNREVRLESPVTRVVVLSSAECEIIYALAGGEAVLGKGAYCDYPPEAGNVPVLQSGGDSNLEEIVALKPQAVIMNDMDQAESLPAAIEAAGIPVIMTASRDINGVYDSIGLIGKVMGRDAEAGALVAHMKERLAAIESKTPENTEKSVYFEVSPLEYGLWTAGSGTFMDEIAGLLGLSNAFGDVQGWGEVSQEQVISRNPDYIVTVTMYNGEGTRPEEEILNRAGWQNIRAVDGKNVFFIESDKITRPGPRLADGAETLYSMIYE